MKLPLEIQEETFIVLEGKIVEVKEGASEVQIPKYTSVLEKLLSDQYPTIF